MSTDITTNENYNSEFDRIEDLGKVIDSCGGRYAYEFDIVLPNGKTVGKVGDTCAPLRREMEWAKAYKDWFKVKFNYLGATDIDSETFFRDYAIHAYGKQHLGWKQVPREDFPAGEHYTQEAYYGADANNVSEAVKQLRDGICSGQITAQLYHRKDDGNDDAPTEPYVPRANQQVCIDNIINAINNGRHHLLCAAHPRFGKSFTALYAIDKLGNIDFVMVVSAVADAHDEWKDTVNLPNFRDNWVFLDSKDLAGGTGHNIADAINDGKKVVVFCTLQDIEGDEKKAKHAEIYKFAKRNSFLIVDETHNGGRGITFSKKIKQIGTIDDADEEEIEFAGKANEVSVNFGFVNQLHLSGTPYRILLTDEFAPADIVYMASYSDLLFEKHAWFVEHAGEDEQNNPYYEFPERYNFVYNLNQIPDDDLKQFIDENGLPRLAELFAVIPGEDKFVNEGVVRSFIKAIWGGFSGSGCWGFLVDKVLNASVKKFHILMKLPSIAACDAFAKLIADCDEFAGYAVILATSNRQKNPTVKSIKSQIKLADASDETAGTLTLTCQRLSAAVSVKQWNVAINAADGRSAQDYDQFAQRVCTPYVEEYVAEDGSTCRKLVKPNVFVIDLVPERVLSVSMQAAIAKCAARGVSSPADVIRELEKEASSMMTFFVSGIESMKQVTAVDVMDMSANYAKTSTIDIAVAKVPFCASLFNGDVAEIMDSMNGISSGVSFETKVYEGADDTDASDKREKPTDNGDDSDSTDSPLPSKLGDKVDTSPVDMDKIRREQMAKQRAFFARLGYLAVLAHRRLDSLDALLDECDATEDGRRQLMNVVGLSMDDCRAIAAAVKSNPLARIAADNLVYNLTRRMNDENMTDKDKLAVFASTFSKLGDAEVVTPAAVANPMCSKLSDDFLYGIIGSGSRIIDFSSETGEFSLALLLRFEELGVFASEARNSICSIPASLLAYECLKKAYGLLGLDADNIYPFTSYDLLKVIKSDNGSIDESAVARISDILKQAKKPCEISLDDVVEEGADKVDIEAVVGNPPYQMNDGGAYASAMPIYQIFSDFVKHVSDVHCIVEPARWMTGGKGLNRYRNGMMHDTHIKSIDDFINSKDVFPNVDIKGGIVIYLYDKAYDGPCTYTRHGDGIEKTTVRHLYSDGCDIILRDSNLADIYRSVHHDSSNEESVADICSSQKPYGLRSDFFGNEAKYSLPSLKESEIDNGYSVLGLDAVSKKRVVKYADNGYPFPKNGQLGKYKLFIPRNYGCGILGEVPASPVLADPNMACTETFVELGGFDTEVELENLYSYFKTKFFRALVGIKKQDQSASRSIYEYVPLQDFSSSSDIDWSKPVSDIDSQLYSKYGLSDEEIEFIEQNIQPMD